MYDRAETREATDRLWRHIRDGLQARGIEAPHELSRGDGAYWPAWQAPSLVLSQTCGLPFRARLHGQVTLIGTPDYGVDGCPPGYYRSVLIARADDARTDAAAFGGAALAFNEALSQSGWAAVHEHFQSLGVPLFPALQTGSHRESARAVAEGRADFAAIDAVTWRLLCRHDGFAARLRVFAQTRPTPGLPLIAAKGAPRRAIFEAVAEAIAALGEAERLNLGLQGIVDIPQSAYLALPIPPAPAQIQGER
nr:PhnD/SsuA/transferrin family substrate-binding protein [Pseudotabrizicola algicola]